MDQFPGNSHTARRAADKDIPAKSDTASDPKKVQKVVTGKVSERKKPLGSRFKDMFISQADGGSFAEHLVENVVVPKMKDMALSIVTQIVDGVRMGVEEVLFGPDDKGHRSRSSTSYGSTRPTVSYHRMNSQTATRRFSDRPPAPNTIRRSNRVKEIIVSSREQGEQVIEELEAMIDGEVGHCTVADFYVAVDVSPTSTDVDWGWADLREARVHELNRDEFVILMPRPKFIN